MKEVQETSADRFRKDHLARFRIGGRMGAAQGDAAPATVFRRIDDVKDDVVARPFANRHRPQVVVRALVAPASLAVPG